MCVSDFLKVRVSTSKLYAEIYLRWLKKFGCSIRINVVIVIELVTKHTMKVEWEKYPHNLCRLINILLWSSFTWISGYVLIKVDVQLDFTSKPWVLSKYSLVWLWLDGGQLVCELDILQVFDTFTDTHSTYSKHLWNILYFQRISIMHK